MGRGRIKTKFRDNIRPGERSPTKDLPFAGSSIPNADPTVFRELKAAISKIEAKFGVDLPQGNLGFTEDDRGFIGVHFGEGDNRTVLFHKSFFNRSSAEIISDLRREFKSKWSVDSNAPLQYVAIHEFGHSIWVDRIEGKDPRLFKLNKSIAQLYRAFRKEVDGGRNPISQYATTNLNEFVAETFVKGVIGKKQNKYSRKLLKLFRDNRNLLTRIR